MTAHSLRSTDLWQIADRATCVPMTCEDQSPSHPCHARDLSREAHRLSFMNAERKPLHKKFRSLRLNTITAKPIMM